ncbi:hypothetical protein FN976_12255 [Caenimonas sedimenti]|uniref:DUF4148 domain-containing protein n=1 Tax=Caenimonas sedimenti TaxID=2596921 RepID=A0A562ZS12_9BURK|nr:hypothetical protein [Caenimonas sedimenti]TWO71085.1 hypothetical protein FN976_12255 [Caenimonas sedimenti]
MTQAFVRAAATVLATTLLSAGAVLAQAQAPNTRIDTAPPPAEERNSVGTVEIEPVLAKKRYLEQLARSSGEPDTRTMGAGPANVVRRAQAGEDLKLQRAVDAAHRRSHSPIAP